MLTKNTMTKAIRFAMLSELDEFKSPVFEYFCKKLANKKPAFRRNLLRFYRDFNPMTQRTYLEFLYRQGRTPARKKQKKCFSILRDLFKEVKFYVGL